ncbi:MAG: hypothetical protein ACYC0X_08005 [Pirellulaceae bacterium]
MSDNAIKDYRSLSEEVTELDPAEVVCRQRLGGLLRHYERQAA